EREVDWSRWGGCKPDKKLATRPNRANSATAQAPQTAPVVPAWLRGGIRSRGESYPSHDAAIVLGGTHRERERCAQGAKDRRGFSSGVSNCEFLLRHEKLGQLLLIVKEYHLHNPGGRRHDRPYRP